MNKFVNLLFVLCLLSLRIVVQGQEIGRYHFEDFDLAHKAGIPGVYSMYQDVTGVIWLGSTNGVYRYDGSRIIEFDKEQRKILGKTNFTFLQADNGDVIIGSDYGICRYNIRSNSVRLLIHENRVFNNRSQYYPICFRNIDELWFVVSGVGIGMLKGSRVSWMPGSRKFQGENMIKDAYFNPQNGKMYLSSYIGPYMAIYDIEKDLCTIDSLHETVSLEMINSNFFRIQPECILSVNQITNQRTVFEPDKNKLSNNVLYSKAVVVDEEWIWISLRDGILPFNFRQGRYGEIFGIENDTKSSLLRHISELFIDKEGNIWVCTETNGIKVLNRNHLNRFQYLTDYGSTNNIIMDIEAINDSLLLVCPLVEVPRLVNINTNSHRSLLSKGSTLSSSFNSVRIDSSTILLNKQKGELYTFDTKSFQIKQFPSPITSISKVIVTSQPNILLIYSENQLYRCKYVNGQLKVEKSILLGYPVESLIYNPFLEQIYCSNQESGAQIDAKSLSIQMDEKPFSGSFIDYCWGKDKSLWLATRSGLEHYNDKKQMIESYNTTNGLNNDVVYSIQPSNDSSVLYLSTNLGISSFHIATKKIRNYTIAAGLLESEHNGGASTIDSKGRFYFGNIKGITAFREPITADAVKPFLIIQDILVDDTLYSRSQNPSFIQSINLYPYNESFGINYSLLSTSEPGKLIYSYKIEGIDNNFHRSNTANPIRMPKPAPGTYTILLRGEIEGGAFVEKQIQLIVHAPFYLKLWFIIPAVLLFHVFIYVLFRKIIKSRLRKKQLEIESERRLYEQKSQIARELHDNVGARLSMMLNTMDWLGKKPQLEMNDLNEIKENTKAVIQGLRDSIWVMDKSQISSEELFDKIKYYTNQILRSSPVHFTFDDFTHKPINLNTTQALNLFRIVQESLNNAMKYSKASHIAISLSYEGETGIVFKISDNGIGFDTTRVINGHGLRNMQVRAGEINANLTIQSVINEGTSIIVSLYIV
ncbi:MAG: sensor histidine kinase [Bacteroidales bacterium]|nr:sensor histidine kinase [Bacteroidales bacterium]